MRSERPEVREEQLVLDLSTRREDRLRTAGEIGDFLGVPASWVYAQARAERIPYIRLGRYVRFDHESVAEWARERERGPTARPVPPAASV
jgi:excisionase family DNA binding protein